MYTSIIKNVECVCLHSQYDVIIYLFASSFCILYSVIKRNIYLNKNCASRIITPNEGKGKSIIMNFSCYIIKFYILQIFLYSISMNRKTEVFFFTLLNTIHNIQTQSFVLKSNVASDINTNSYNLHNI